MPVPSRVERMREERVHAHSQAMHRWCWVCFLLKDLIFIWQLKSIRYLQCCACGLFHSSAKLTPCKLTSQKSSLHSFLCFSCLLSREIERENVLVLFWIQWKGNGERVGKVIIYKSHKSIHQSEASFSFCSWRSNASFMDIILISQDCPLSTHQNSLLCPKKLFFSRKKKPLYSIASTSEIFFF